jgi:hypothetical protein
MTSLDNRLREDLRQRAESLSINVATAMANVERRGLRRRTARRLLSATVVIALVTAGSVVVPKLLSGDATFTPAVGDVSPSTQTPTESNPIVVKEGETEGHRWQLLVFYGRERPGISTCAHDPNPAYRSRPMLNMQFREVRDGPGWGGKGVGYCDVPYERKLGEPVIDLGPWNGSQEGFIWGLASDRVVSVRVEILDHDPLNFATLAVGDLPLSAYFARLPAARAVVTKLIGFDRQGKLVREYSLPADPYGLNDPPRPTPRS